MSDIDQLIAAGTPGFELMQAQQKAFLKAMTGGMPGAWPTTTSPSKPDDKEDLGDIKRQLAELQEKLSKLS